MLAPRERVLTITWWDPLKHDLQMLSILAETTVSTYGSVEIARLKKKKMNNLPGSFDKFQFGTSAMVASDFDGLGGYRTLAYEGQVPTEPYNCCFSRVFQASVCIATYWYVGAIPTYRVDRLCDMHTSVHGFCFF